MEVPVIERHKRDGESNSLLTYYKIGVLGCAPKGFFETFASNPDHQARYIHANTARDELERTLPGKENAKARAFRKKHIISVVHAMADNHLSKGEDVMVDRYYNHPENRKSIAGLARIHGGFAVAFDIITPMAVIERRIEEWTEEGDFSGPGWRQKRAPLAVAANMEKNIVRPSDEPTGHNYYHIELDGNTDTDGLMEQAESQMIKLGLMTP